MAIHQQLNWNFLNYFCTVAERKSIKLAAIHLNVSSSTISEGIQSLEKMLGTKLISRESRRMELTVHGSALYNEIRPVFENQYRILESIKRPAEDLPAVAVGLVPSDSFPGSFDVINSIVAYSRAGKFMVRSCDHDRLESMLERSEIDIGLSCFPIHTKNVTCHKILEGQLRFYAHKDFAGVPFRSLILTLKVGLFGADTSHHKVQSFFQSAFKDIAIQYLLTDYPSLLFNSCLERTAIIGYASRSGATLHPDFCEVDFPELKSFNFDREQYLMWSKRLEGTPLHRHLQEISQRNSRPSSKSSNEDVVSL